jgi:hypothetical protein
VIEQPKTPPAIFILGMLPRTGTNHLADLFGLHDDVAVLESVFEDHLVRFSPLLRTYVNEVTRHWSPEWEVPADEPTELLRSLGDGVVSWLRGHRPGATIVTKMPRVENIDGFFDLFPDCGLVVLVRDGRSVVESGVRSFGWTYEWGFRMWNTAAETVLRFRETQGDNPLLRIVRYEELIDDESAVMADLFGAFGLDPERFNPAEADALPVRGSSTLTEAGELHWEPVARTASFDPRVRWRDWDPFLHRRFNAVCGASQGELGYGIETASGDRPLGATVRSVRDRIGARRRGAKAALRRAQRVVRQTWW